MPSAGDLSEGESGSTETHWVHWHRAYENPDSPLSARLRLVQAALRAALDRQAPGPIRLISMCAGQGRDVTDVVAAHARAGDVQALLVELDPGLAEFARSRADSAGLGDHIVVMQDDAASASLYADFVPAHVVLVCGVFGNISEADIAGTVAALPSFCASGASVIWTRHRRPPDLTPTVRALFERAGFEEVSFEAPAGYILAVGCHRLVVPPLPFDPGRHLFDFTGDGQLPA